MLKDFTILMGFLAPWTENVKDTKKFLYFKVHLLGLGLTFAKWLWANPNHIHLSASLTIEGVACRTL